MSLAEQIDNNNIPKHIAIIMDGNGRWAKGQGEQRLFGHNEGATAARKIVQAAVDLGVKYLTLYTFSTENWNRPKDEVSGLMELLLKTVQQEIQMLTDNNIRLLAIGDIEGLPKLTLDGLKEGMRITQNNTRLNLVMALNYSGKSEILNATIQLAKQVKDGKLSPEDIDEALFSSHLYTAGIPDPELMIRTSGENRLSNFLLWQLAYSEFYFTDKLWPDFDKEDFYKAILSYQNRERRFGMTSEQIIDTTTH